MKNIALIMSVQKKREKMRKKEIKCAMGRWQWDRLVSVDAAAANTTVLLRVAVSASTAALV